MARATTISSDCACTSSSSSRGDEMMKEESKASDLEFITVDASDVAAAAVPTTNVKTPTNAKRTKEDGEALYVCLHVRLCACTDALTLMYVCIRAAHYILLQSVVDAQDRDECQAPGRCVLPPRVQGPLVRCQSIARACACELTRPVRVARASRSSCTSSGACSSAATSSSSSCASCSWRSTFGQSRFVYDILTHTFIVQK